MKNKLIWFAAQSAIGYLAYASITGHHAQWNIYRFLAWLMTIMWALILVGKFLPVKNTDTKAKTNNRLVPAWLSFGSDFLIAILLASGGFFFYAALKMIEAFLEQYYFYIEEAK